MLPDSAAFKLHSERSVQASSRQFTQDDSGDEASSPSTAGGGRQSGRVVGICQRNWRDYVVTLPAKEASGVGGGKVSDLQLPYPARAAWQQLCLHWSALVSCSPNGPGQPAAEYCNSDGGKRGVK